MQALNVELLQWMAAGQEPTPWLLLAACVLARGGATLCGLITAWVVWRSPSERTHVLVAWIAAGVSSLLSHALAKHLGMPRPFVLDLTPAYIAHGASAAMPSTHACVMATVAFVLLCKPTLRPVGAVLLALAVATGWARIYVGVHFPFDIVAGFALATAIASVCVAAQRAFRWAKTSSVVTHPASIVHGEQR